MKKEVQSIFYKSSFIFWVLLCSGMPELLLGQQVTPGFRETKKQAGHAYITNANSTFTPKVIFYGSTALSGEGADITKTLTASGQLMVTANIFEKFSVNLGANLLNVNPVKTKKDSVDFNSLMFPETGNFGFLVHPSYRFALHASGEDEYSVIPFYEFAYRKVSIDSPQLAFKVYNHSIGAGFEWNHHPDEKNDFTLNASVYYHWFNIPVEDVKRFTTFVNDSLFEKAAVHSNNVLVKSMGIKFTVLYNSFVFFADFRKNFGTSELSDNDPFKGGAVNIGFQTLFRIKTF